ESPPDGVPGHQGMIRPHGDQEPSGAVVLQVVEVHEVVLAEVVARDRVEHDRGRDERHEDEPAAIIPHVRASSPVAKSSAATIAASKDVATTYTCHCNSPARPAG